MDQERTKPSLNSSKLIAELLSRKKEILPEKDLGLKELLKKEALSVIQESGPHGLSLRELARRLKVSHAAPYRHYQTKEELLAAIVEDGFKELAKRMHEVRVNDTDLRNQFLNMGKAYVNFAKQHPHHTRLMFGDFVQNPQEHPACHDAGQSAFQELLEVVIEMQEKNLFRKSNPLELAHIIWSSVHGFSMLLIDKQFELLESERKQIKEQGLEFSPDSAIDLIGQIFLRGMGPIGKMN